MCSFLIIVKNKYKRKSLNHSLLMILTQKVPKHLKLKVIFFSNFKCYYKNVLNQYLIRYEPLKPFYKCINTNKASLKTLKSRFYCNTNTTDKLFI